MSATFAPVVHRVPMTSLDNAMDEAVAAVHSPLLTSIYKNENPRPQVTAMLAE